MEPSSNNGPPRSVWDTVRAVLVVLFAFLAVSFPAVNSDLWQHLATGRALLDGSYSFGVDPFAYTTADRVWVNHGWLFDAIAYGTHQGLGGPALVIVKALLIATLAGLFVRLCWQGPRRWLAMLLIVVSLVALSPYALLRPAFVSFCFLGVTVAWLERHPTLASWRSVVPLLLMFVLWANLDEWFLLGPLTVLFWALGSLVSRRSSTDSVTGDRRVSLGWVAVAGLALAVVNPHHVRVFTVPELLDPTIAAEWFDDAHDRAARRSPLDWINSGSLRQPPRLAYGGLVLVGIISFFLRRGGGVPPGRLLIWILFLALSLYRSGATPFFAVVAGPIAALNLQEWLAQRDSTKPSPTPPHFLTRVLQFASVPVLAGAVLAAWTGWIRDFPGEPPSWRVVLDPSLEAAARQFAEWHRQDNVSPQARGLPTSAAAAHVLAWLCPAEKSFCDDRPHLFSLEVRSDFAALRQSLFLPGDREKAARWRELLDKHRITHVLVDRADDGELHLGIGRLFTSPIWNLHHLHGGAAVFAKRDQVALRAPTVDPWQRAFRPSAGEIAPATWPGRDPMLRSWLDAVDRASLPDQPGRKEGLVWQAHFEAQRVAYGRHLRLQWEHGLAVSVVGLLAAETQPLGAASGAMLRWACLSHSREMKAPTEGASLHDLAVQVLERFVGMRDEGPPGSLFAAVRAGRRALHVNPDNARSHLYLGEAYLRLRRQTRERGFSPALISLDRMRRTQALVALRHAARLDPGLVAAHELLADLYGEIGYHDLALEHVRALVKSSELRGRGSDKATVVAQQRFERWNNMERQLARQVRDAQLALRAGGLDAFAQARLALRHGLPGQALAALDTDVSSIGRDGMLLKLDLMLHSGQTREVRDLLQAILESPGDQNDFRWLHVYLSAASGDYAEADANLAKLSDVPNPSIAISRILSLYLLERAARVPIGYPFEMLLQRDEFTQVLRLAEIAALRGVLAVEVGDIELARQQLRRSLQWFEPGAAARLARGYVELIEVKRQ